MARLTGKARHEMLMKTPKEFGLPGGRFPLNDANHQRLAISGATRSERAGNISPAQEASIKAKARAKLKGK